MEKTRVIATSDEMLAYTDSILSNSMTIGFVPTMGALHIGHASLIKKAKEECDVVIVSVFVNPTQFNDKTDLDTYPRTFETDKRLLDEHGVEVMFYPTAKEVYPKGTDVAYDLDGLDELMEGAHRPGHFNGVVQVVTRLFDLTKPTKAFFGEKDFQQLAIIKHMTKKLGYDAAVKGCSTIREKNGVAMSSRNARLSDAGLNKASILFETLCLLKAEVGKGDHATMLKRVESNLRATDGVRLEYLELVDAVTLQPATPETKEIQACIAAWVEGVRLIDNLRVK